MSNPEQCESHPTKEEKFVRMVLRAAAAVRQSPDLLVVFANNDISAEEERKHRLALECARQIVSGNCPVYRYTENEDGSDFTITPRLKAVSENREP